MINHPMGGNLTFHSLLIIWLVLLMSLVILKILSSCSCSLPHRSRHGTASPRKPHATSPLGNGLQIMRFFCKFEHGTIAVVVFMPDFILFSHGYSKPRCSLNFPASSQWTHCSSISSLFTLWPHYHLISVPGMLLDCRVSNAPVMLLLSAESSEILTPFPALLSLVSGSCLIAWPVLFCPVSCQLLCVSPACQSFPPILCSLFLQLSASYGISFFQSVFKDTVTAFQVSGFSSPEWGGT